MQKKILYIFFILSLVLLCPIFFVGCNKEPIHVHTYGEWKTKTPATCTKAEIENRACTCGHEETREGDSALAHSESGWIVDGDSTCTTTGTKHKECTVCEETLETETIEKKAHSMTEWSQVSSATCSEAEVLERHCSTCNTQNETKQGEVALGHTESEWKVLTPPTCSSFGVNYKECLVCHVELEKDMQVAKLQHEESEWIVEVQSTCSSFGVNYKECLVCHVELARDTQVAKLEHELTEWVLWDSAHCETPEIFRRDCRNFRCDYYEEKDGAQPTGHKWGNEVKTLNDGYYLVSKKCSECKEIHEEQKDYRNVYFITEYCDVKIEGYYNTKLIIGDKIKLSLEIADCYIVEKLVYYTGTTVDGEFVDNNDPTYIYNNSFIMPNSDIGIECICVPSNATGNIRNSEITLIPSMWSSNYTLDAVYFTLNDEYLINEPNVNSNGYDQGYIGMWNFEAPNNEFKFYNSLKFAIKVCFTFKSDNRYELLTGTGKFNSESFGGTIWIKNSQFVSVTQTFKVHVWDNNANESTDLEIEFRVCFEFDVIREHRVTYISENDQVENATILTNQLITNIPEGEWYLDKDFTQKWNFQIDRVTQDMFLYKKEN